MNWIKRTLLFIGFIIVFAFAFSADTIPAEKNQIEKQGTSFSADSSHSSVFIEPQTNTLTASPQKTIDYSIAKYLENYLVIIPDFKIRKHLTAYASQDINRCEMVSLLLFPFHYFW